MRYLYLEKKAFLSLKLSEIQKNVSLLHICFHIIFSNSLGVEKSEKYSSLPIEVPSSPNLNDAKLYREIVSIAFIVHYFCSFIDKC